MKSVRYRFARGVTLVELLVVITIMMMMLSLVAPLTVDVVKKSEAQSEYLTFCRAIKKSAFQAFAGGQALTFSLEEHSARVTRQDGSEQVKQYEYLHFKPQSFVINQNGFPTTQSIELDVRKRTITLDLVALIEGEL